MKNLSKYYVLKKKIQKDLPKLRYCLRSPIAKIKKYIQYTFLKLLHPGMVVLSGVELSNFCNLMCPNCPTPVTKIKRGFASDETIKLALKYAKPNDSFSFHRQGEPFLHKDFLKYLKIATEMGLKTIVSTNGILLDDEKIELLARIQPYDMEISLHTKESVAAFKKLTEYLTKKEIMFVNYYANRLSHNSEDVDRWLDELDVSSDARKYIRDVCSHSWAGNVESRKADYCPDVIKKRVEACYFIKTNRVSLRWDGTFVACCMDSENETVIGHIKDFYKVAHNKQGYALCRHCDASWVNAYEK